MTSAIFLSCGFAPHTAPRVPSKEVICPTCHWFFHGHPALNRGDQVEVSCPRKGALWLMKNQCVKWIQCITQAPLIHREVARSIENNYSIGTNGKSSWHKKTPSILQIVKSQTEIFWRCLPVSKERWLQIVEEWVRMLRKAGPFLAVEPICQSAYLQLLFLYNTQQSHTFLIPH